MYPRPNPKLRKAACAAVYTLTIPVRIVICGLLSAIMILWFPILVLMDLHRFGCQGEWMNDWDDWTSLCATKLLYWDFLILGKWPE